MPDTPSSFHPSPTGGGGRGGFQSPMDQHPSGPRSPGGVSPFNRWSSPPRHQMQLPQFKSNSSASLHLLADQRTDSDAGSMYSPSPWSEYEENDSKLSDYDFQGSDTSLFAQRFKEKQANLPQPPVPPGMTRSKSLEDIRKVVSAVTGHNTMHTNLDAELLLATLVMTAACVPIALPLHFPLSPLPSLPLLPLGPLSWYQQRLGLCPECG